MEMKQSYNFSGSSCLFCYRGIFSGLSNEEPGAASYNLAAMDASVLQLIATVNTYQRILHRYASQLVKNKLAAALIVEDVFSEYTNRVTDIAAPDTRKFLQTTTITKCAQWLAAKPVVHDMRKPKNPT
jgi:hypothetical protein